MKWQFCTQSWLNDQGRVVCVCVIYRSPDAFIRQMSASPELIQGTF